MFLFRDGTLTLMNRASFIALVRFWSSQPIFVKLLISLLKTIKAEGIINTNNYKRLYPTGAGSPKYYGLPKIHKTGVPLRPIISSKDSATYETAKELAKILKPLVGRSPHHVQNNKDFLDSIKNIKIKPEECIMSYDVSALFTSIP